MSPAPRLATISPLKAALPTALPTGYTAVPDLPVTRGSSPRAGDPGCPICLGIGRLAQRVGNAPPVYGWCACTEAGARAHRQEAINVYSSLGRLRKVPLERMVVRPGQEAASIATQEFVADPAGLLTLMGPVGTGKTAWAASLGWALFDQGRSIYFSFVPELMHRLRRSFNPETGIGFDEYYDGLIEADVLILDGMDAENSTPWVQRTMRELLEARVVRNAATIITTAQPLGTLGHYTASRLLSQDAARVALLVGKDQRTNTTYARTLIDLYHRLDSKEVICSQCHLRPHAAGCRAQEAA